jgi:hypothetical protein
MTTAKRFRKSMSDLLESCSEMIAEIQSLTTLESDADFMWEGQDYCDVRNDLLRKIRSNVKLSRKLNMRAHAND